MLTRELARQQQTIGISMSIQGRRRYEVTRDVSHFIAVPGAKHGLVTAFCRHALASPQLHEDVADDIKTDLDGFFLRLARRALTGTSHRTTRRNAGAHQVEPDTDVDRHSSDAPAEMLEKWQGSSSSSMTQGHIGDR